MSSTAKDTGVSPSSFEEFDIVIVGGGLSGLVLAARLSENPNLSVGVLEIGLWRPNDPKIMIPYRMIEMVGDPDYQCVTKTVPQKHIGGRQLPCARGRVLGGGSTVNFLAWHRGSKRDYDSFEELGNPGWNWENLAKAGRKSETFHPPDTEDQLAVSFTDASFHGQDGPLQTSFSGWVPKTNKAFFDVTEKFGLAKNDQWHNGINTGTRSSTSSINPKGVRSSSVTAYYEPNASRANLSVLCGATATKVELEAKGDLHTATGVHYLLGDQNYFVKARKEVIISAGVFGSPHLLELSGVGNPSILQPLGIETKINNPNVGENLQDHIMTWATYLTNPGDHTQDALVKPEFAAEAAAAYAAPSNTQAHGPLAGTISAMLYLPVEKFIPEPELSDLKRKLREDTLPLAANVSIKYQLDNLDVPDQGSMEWVYIPRKFASPSGMEPGRSYISLMVALQYPFSRGHTHVASADPKTPPEIDPRYLENSWDKDLLLHGLEQVDKLAQMEPFASMIDRRADPPPGDDSRAAFEKYLQETVGPGIHWVGSASMLPKEKGGVVDSRCKVYGSTNLRVIDASIIPLEISAHLQGTLYAIAERAAELIKEDHLHN